VRYFFLIFCFFLVGCSSVPKKIPPRIEHHNRTIETTTTDYLYDYSFFYKGIGVPQSDSHIIVIDTIISRVFNNKIKHDRFITTINKLTNEVRFELNAEPDTLQSTHTTIIDTIYITATEYVNDTK
jgi:hypothetical protein